LILAEEPTIPGTLVLCRLTAVLDAEQTGKEETKRSDRFIVTPLVNRWSRQFILTGF